MENLASDVTSSGKSLFYYSFLFAQLISYKDIFAYRWSWMRQHDMYLNIILARRTMISGRLNNKVKFLAKIKSDYQLFKLSN